MAYVRVKGTKSTHRFPLDNEGGPLSLNVLQAQYPSARGLLYTDGEEEVVVPAQKNMIRPPVDGWGERPYSVLFAEPAAGPPESETLTDLQSQLAKLLIRQQGPLVLAPDRKINAFDGKAGEVRDFTISIENAFQRYSIPEDQKGAFLLDYVRAGPKAEVKALLAEKKSVAEILTFLRESYGDKLAVGELQRLFLERKQRHGETIRDFAVDLEKRFLRLTQRDAKLFSSPNSALAEQFIEGLDDNYLRNTCRDLYEHGTVTSFRELRGYALKREGQEEARNKAINTGVAYQAAIQTNDRRAVATGSNSEELLGVFKEMAERVVSMVKEAVSPDPTRQEQHPYLAPRPWQYPPTGPMYPSGNPYMNADPGARGRCYACGNLGHFARNCPARGAPSNRNRQQGREFHMGPPRPDPGRQPMGRPSTEQEQQGLNGHPLLS